MTRFIRWALLFSGLLLITHAPGLPALAEESHPSIAIEAMYAEAVLAFNRKQTNEALKVLDELLKVAPANIEAMELKALSLKSQGDMPKSLQTYLDLIRLKPGEQAAPYHFEAGLITYNLKNYAEAKKHFRRAIVYKFNAGTSQFFMGMIAMQEGDETQAQQRFERVTQIGNPELQVVARYYLAMTYFNRRKGTDGIRELLEARDQAEKLKDSEIARDIYKACQKSIKDYDKGLWFGGVTLLGQYDGNVAAIPNADKTTASAEKKKSMNAIVLAHVGRSSSPMRRFQYVASYRFNTNKNGNEKTREFEYATNTVAIFLTRKPLSRTNPGLRLEGMYQFQNQLEPGSTENYIYKPYLYSATIGLYVRHELRSAWLLQTEFNYKPQTYPNDPIDGSGRQSGFLTNWRSSASTQTRWKILNPLFFVNLEQNSTKGNDYKTQSMTLGVSNQLLFSERSMLNISYDHTLTSYNKRSPKRLDHINFWSVSWLRKISRHWSIIADLGFTEARSTLRDSFQYRKPTVSLGISASL